MLDTIKEILDRACTDALVTRSRVPYTYHHDYVRTQVAAIVSRSEAAQFDATEDELYACTWLYVWYNTAPMLAVKYTYDWASLYDWALDIAHKHMISIQSQV